MKADVAKALVIRHDKNDVGTFYGVCLGERRFAKSHYEYDGREQYGPP
jgi:hypothetical protein